MDPIPEESTQTKSSRRGGVVASQRRNRRGKGPSQQSSTDSESSRTKSSTRKRNRRAKEPSQHSNTDSDATLDSRSTVSKDAQRKKNPMLRQRSTLDSLSTVSKDSRRRSTLDSRSTVSKGSRSQSSRTDSRRSRGSRRTDSRTASSSQLSRSISETSSKGSRRSDSRTASSSQLSRSISETSSKGSQRTDSRTESSSQLSRSISEISSSSSYTARAKRKRPKSNKKRWGSSVSQSSRSSTRSSDSASSSRRAKRRSHRSSRSSGSSTRSSYSESSDNSSARVRRKRKPKRDSQSSQSSSTSSGSGDSRKRRARRSSRQSSSSNGSSGSSGKYSRSNDSDVSSDHQKRQPKVAVKEKGKGKGKRKGKGKQKGKEGDKIWGQFGSAEEKKRKKEQKKVGSPEGSENESIMPELGAMTDAALAKEETIAENLKNIQNELLEIEAELEPKEFHTQDISPEAELEPKEFHTQDILPEAELEPKEFHTQDISRSSVVTDSKRSSVPRQELPHEEASAVRQDLNPEEALISEAENKLDAMGFVDQVVPVAPRRSQMPIPRAMMMTRAARQGQPKMASRPVWATESDASTYLLKNETSAATKEKLPLSPRAWWNENQKDMVPRTRLIERETVPQVPSQTPTHQEKSKRLDSDRLQDARAAWNLRQKEEMRRTSAVVAGIQREKQAATMQPLVNTISVRGDREDLSNNETDMAKVLRLQWNQRQKDDANSYITKDMLDLAEKLKRERQAKQDWNRREKRKLVTKDDAIVLLQSLVRMKFAMRRARRVMAERKEKRRAQEEARRLHEERRRLQEEAEKKLGEEKARALKQSRLQNKWAKLVTKRLGEASEKILMEVYSRKDAAAWRIQAIWKGRVARENYYRSRRVIRYIQLSWRSHLLRQRMRDVVYLCIQRQTERQKAIEVAQQLETQKKQAEAATKIQSRVRVRLAKKVADAKRDAKEAAAKAAFDETPAGQAAIKAKARTIFTAAELRAIKKQQALEREHERIDAAVFIQSRYRGNVARKKVELVKRIKLREELRLRLKKHETRDRRQRHKREVKVNSAAVKIQSTFRGWLARRAYRSLWLQKELKKGMALSQINELIRDKHGFGLEFEDQTAICEERARLKKIELDRKIERMEKNRAEKIKQDALMQEKSALNIQRVWRGKVVRKHMWEEELRKLQSDALKTKLKAMEAVELSNRHEAAVKLQKAFRGHRVRKQVKFLRRQMKAKREKAILVKRMNAKNRAASKIQANFRGLREKWAVSRMLSAGGRKQLSAQFVDDAVAVREKMTELLNQLTNEYATASTSEQASLAENAGYLGNGRYGRKELFATEDYEDSGVLDAWADLRKLQEAIPAHMQHREEIADAMETLRVALLAKTGMPPNGAAWDRASDIQLQPEAQSGTLRTPQYAANDDTSRSTCTLSRGVPPSRQDLLERPSLGGSPSDLLTPQRVVSISRGVPLSKSGGQTPSKTSMY